MESLRTGWLCRLDYSPYNTVFCTRHTTVPAPPPSLICLAAQERKWSLPPPSRSLPLQWSPVAIAAPVVWI